MTTDTTTIKAHTAGERKAFILHGMPGTTVIINEKREAVFTFPASADTLAAYAQKQAQTYTSERYEWRALRMRAERQVRKNELSAKWKFSKGATTLAAEYSDVFAEWAAEMIQETA